MKYCIDCRHHKSDPYNPHDAICTKQIFADCVTGETHHQTCREVRSDPALCGKSADWFEPKA